MSRIFCVLMGLLLVASSSFGLAISNSELAGLSWNYTQDAINDFAGPRCEVFGMGHAVAGNYLYVVVATDFPSGGIWGGDSYSSWTHVSTGDLYINVGGTFQTGGGSVYGVATTSHGNVVQQAYPGETWTSVNAGSLYGSAEFADGTYEQYERFYPAQPSDGDGSNRVNSYPSLIKTGDEVAGDVSGVLYRQSGSQTPWAYEIFYKIDLSALGMGAGDNVQLAWSMECGNDLAQHFFTNPVPEPATMMLMGSGLVALAGYRRRRNN